MKNSDIPTQEAVRILSKIGLSDEACRIYLDLLQNGASNILEIHHRTKINRPLIYRTIPHLIELRLLSKVLRGKRSLFDAESPENLQKLFQSLEERFNRLIPSLNDLYRISDGAPTITVLEGKKGVVRIFEDIVFTLDKGGVYYRYSSRNQFSESHLSQRYKELRDLKGIQRYVITSESRAKTKTQKLNREIAYFPAGTDPFDDNVSKVIYADKVAILDFNSGISVLIENEILAKFEEKIFRQLYKHLRRLDGFEF